VLLEVFHPEGVTPIDLVWTGECLPRVEAARVRVPTLFHHQRRWRLLQTARLAVAAATERLGTRRRCSPLATPIGAGPLPLEEFLLLELKLLLGQCDLLGLGGGELLLVRETICYPQRERE